MLSRQTGYVQITDCQTVNLTVGNMFYKKNKDKILNNPVQFKRKMKTFGKKFERMSTENSYIRP